MIIIIISRIIIITDVDGAISNALGLDLEPSLQHLLHPLHTGCGPDGGKIATMQARTETPAFVKVEAGVVPASPEPHCLEFLRNLLLPIHGSVAFDRKGSF